MWLYPPPWEDTNLMLMNDFCDTNWFQKFPEASQLLNQCCPCSASLCLSLAVEGSAISQGSSNFFYFFFQDSTACFSMSMTIVKFKDAFCHHVLIFRSNQASCVCGKNHCLGRVDLSPSNIKGKNCYFADLIDMHVCGLCDHFDLDISTC